MTPQQAADNLTPERVVREHAPRIFRLARRLVGNDADAEDVTQDVLLKVLGKLGTFRGEAAFPTWLHRVTVNAALAHLRKRAVREEGRTHDPLDRLLEAGDHARSLRPWSIEAERQAIDKETQELVQASIDNLPESYREVLVLSDLEGMPNAEIADLLGLSLPAVKTRLHRARLMLRESLAPHFEAQPT